ncbi:MULTISPECIES: type IV secretion system protein VirB3 [unclassified Rhodanobacter]|uniref:Type IV secretion system protein VirB3 n=1 Tax=Rhodanobacter humi TaxID=1888173 RepID=A0ABV4AVE1_9GAMM
MIRRDPLFKGCTRPAMVFGVPLTPLVLVALPVILLAIWVNFLLALALIPIVIAMKVFAKADPNKFRLHALRLWCRFLPHRNRNGLFWKASTYSPIAFQKRKG